MCFALDHSTPDYLHRNAGSSIMIKILRDSRHCLLVVIKVKQNWRPSNLSDDYADNSKDILHVASSALYCETCFLKGLKFKGCKQTGRQSTRQAGGLSKNKAIPESVTSMHPDRSSAASAVKADRELRHASVTVAIREHPPSLKLLNPFRLLVMWEKPLWLRATQPETSRTCRAVRLERCWMPLSEICRIFSDEAIDLSWSACCSLFDWGKQSNDALYSQGFSESVLDGDTCFNKALPVALPMHLEPAVVNCRTRSMLPCTNTSYTWPDLYWSHHKQAKDNTTFDAQLRLPDKWMEISPLIEPAQIYPKLIGTVKGL